MPPWHNKPQKGTLTCQDSLLKIEHQAKYRNDSHGVQSAVWQHTADEWIMLGTNICCTWTLQASTFTISYPQSAMTHIFVAVNNNWQLANLDNPQNMRVLEFFQLAAWANTGNKLWKWEWGSVNMQWTSTIDSL